MRYALPTVALAIASCRSQVDISSKSYEKTAKSMSLPSCAVWEACDPNKTTMSTLTELFSRSTKSVIIDLRSVACVTIGSTSSTHESESACPLQYSAHPDNGFGWHGQKDGLRWCAERHSSEFFPDQPVLPDRVSLGTRSHALSEYPSRSSRRTAASDRWPERTAFFAYQHQPSDDRSLRCPATPGSILSYANRNTEPTLA